jgi:hypothetical protein
MRMRSRAGATSGSARTLRRFPNASNIKRTSGAPGATAEFAPGLPCRACVPIVRHLVTEPRGPRAEARSRETVTAFLRRTGWATRDRKYGWQFRKGLPTILEINGEAVLSKDWRCRRIGVRADVRFVSHPLGDRLQVDSMKIEAKGLGRVSSSIMRP